MKSSIRTLLLIATAGLFIAPAARAAVYFTLDQSGGLSVNPGGTLTFGLSLHVTNGEQVTGVDYTLNETSGLSTGVFSITGVSGRSTSVFSDVYRTDSAVTSSDTLNPSSIDLGALIPTSGNPVSNGTYEIASYTLTLASNAKSGTYDLSPTITGYSNGDWIDAQGNDNNMSQPLTVPVSVAAPEPTTWALLLVSLVLGLRAYSPMKSKLSARI